MLKKIVVVDDNKEIVTYITNYLQREEDFIVTAYSQGLQAINAVSESKPDVILINLELNDMSGESVCIGIRRKYPANQLPIILYSKDNTSEVVIKSLDSGANDYMTIPLHLEELLARINARIRIIMPEKASDTLYCGDLEMNLVTFEAKRKDEKIELTAKEFELLKYLMINKGRIQTREKLLNVVWGYSSMVDTRVVDVHVGKLRKKIDEGHKKHLIQTLRGFGYKIED